MKVKFLILAIFLAVYLNRAYAHIYNNVYSKPMLGVYTGQVFLPNKGSNFKYVALGDSLTAGVGAGSIEQTYPFLFAKKLEDEGRNVQLIDLAVPGSKVKDVLAFQLPKALREKPDQVTLLVGINDVHALTPRSDFERDYSQIVRTLMNEGTKITLINIPYLGSSLLMLPPYNFFFDNRTKQLNEVIARIAQNNRVKLIDLYSSTRGFNLYSSDLFHPSGEGYNLWGKIINAD